MSVSLKKLAKKERTAKPFGVADIEASSWIDHKVTGFYHKREDGSEILEYFYNTKRDVDNFLDFIMSSNNPISDIYAHFGGKYDFLFFIKAAIENKEYMIDKMLPRGSGLLCFELSKIGKTRDIEFISMLSKKEYIGKKGKDFFYKQRTISFKDSGAMLPFALGSLTESFNVEHKKMLIDYNFKKVTPKLLEYLESDLKGLYEVIEKYRDWPLIKKSGLSSTAAGQAMRIFRTTLDKDLFSLPKSVDTFVREAYFGGRTEIFKPLFNPSDDSMIHCFDVNSLYPTVMRETDHFPGDFKTITYEYDPDSLGVYEAEVEVPEDMYLPPLATVIKIGKSNKLVFPVGRFSGKWTTRELEYARSLGIRIIKTGKGVIFEDRGPMFREYIDMLYEIKEKAENNSVDYTLSKLLMNSCYGRFGLNLERESIEFDDGQSGIIPIGEIPMKDGSVIRFCKKPIMLEKSFTNVGISCWVTSESRIFMHKKMNPICESLFYTDTDSLFTTKWLENVTGLGGLKHEYSGDAACFLLPKTYLIQNKFEGFLIKDKKGKHSRADRKIVMKGFNKDDIQHFGMNDFAIALEGDLRRLTAKTSSKIATFKTAIKKGNVLTLLDESTRGIKSVYNKRKIVKTSKGYDTEPLVVRNGEIL